YDGLNGRLASSFSHDLFRYTCIFSYSFFFFNAPATTEIYTLSLHDALPISGTSPTCWKSSTVRPSVRSIRKTISVPVHSAGSEIDRKSTRLNSSHSQISYAVFCLKKKKKKKKKKTKK